MKEISLFNPIVLNKKEFISKLLSYESNLVDEFILIIDKNSCIDIKFMFKVKSTNEIYALNYTPFKEFQKFITNYSEGADYEVSISQKTIKFTLLNYVSFLNCNWISCE